MAKNLLQLIGNSVSSMVWLGCLYAGLLYVAVGALGVSEITSRYGDQAVYIFHVVNVLDEVRQQEKLILDKAEARLADDVDAFAAASAVVRSLGVGAGLPVEKIQPIIDNYSQAPLLTTLLGKPVDAKLEQDWAAALAKVMGLQNDEKQSRDQISKSIGILRGDWANDIALHDDPKGAPTLTKTDIEIAASTASTLRRLGFGLLFSLPREILTLVLALSMGALGSTLQITKTLIAGNESNQLSYYIVRPFQGMVTALVVFVLLKAGQMTISAGATDGLNNFFVAFVGIVSGLMSLEAYRMIENAGASIIKSPDGQARWAFKLKDILAAANLDGDTLAAGIGAAPGDMRLWLAEKQPVPPLQQRLIATYLHQPERDIFSDQGPAEDPSTVEPVAEPVGASAPPVPVAG